MRDTKRKPRRLTYAQRQVRIWLTHNRGIQTVLAMKVGCSQQFVQQVVYGRSRAKHSDTYFAVLRKLREAGWPGAGI